MSDIIRIKNTLLFVTKIFVHGVSFHSEVLGEEFSGGFGRAL